MPLTFLWYRRTPALLFRFLVDSIHGKLSDAVSGKLSVFRLDSVGLARHWLPANGSGRRALGRRLVGVHGAWSGGTVATLAVHVAGALGPRPGRLGTRSGAHWSASGAAGSVHGASHGRLRSATVGRHRTAHWGLRPALWGHWATLGSHRALTLGGHWALALRSHWALLT